MVRLVFYKPNKRGITKMAIKHLNCHTCRWIERDEQLEIRFPSHWRWEPLFKKIVKFASIVWNEGLCEDFDIFPAIKLDIRKIKEKSKEVKRDKGGKNDG